MLSSAVDSVVTCMCNTIHCCWKRFPSESLYSGASGRFSFGFPLGSGPGFPPRLGPPRFGALSFLRFPLRRALGAGLRGGLFPLSVPSVPSFLLLFAFLPAFVRASSLSVWASFLPWVVPGQAPLSGGPPSGPPFRAALGAVVFRFRGAVVFRFRGAVVFRFRGAVVFRFLGAGVFRFHC